MPSQILKKKDLYLGKCLGDLSKQSDVKIDSNNVAIIIRSLNKVFEDAEKFERAGDEEKAYVLFLKYFSILKVIKSKAEYKKQKDYFDNFIGKKNQLTAIEKAEKLSESLKERYDLKEAEAVAKKLSDIDLKEKTTAVVQVEEKETPKAEEKPAAETPGLITSIKLCELLRDNNTKVILMDVRPEMDYSQSHVSFTECINIPEEILVPGSTVSHIQAKLPNDSKQQWSQRMHADYIVLLDWKSTLDDVKVGTPLRTLKDALYKFDLNTIIKSEPLVLQGGYDQWLLFYPTMTTNAHVKKPSDANSANPPSPTLTLDFDYPDLDDNLQYKLTPVNSTISNESVSASNDGVSSDPSVLPTSVLTPSGPTPSVPRVDRSLKPSSSKDSLSLVNDTPSSTRKNPGNLPAGQVVGLNNTIPNVDSNPNSLGSVKITNIVNDNFVAHGSKANNWSKKNNLVSDLSASVEIRQEKESELKNWKHAKAAALSEHQEKLKELEQKLLALDKIKKKEEKDVADLMRMKKRLREELDEEKKKQDEEIQTFDREGKKKLIALELAKKEEQEKKLRLEEVEKLRQDRKKDEKMRDLEKRLEMEEEQKRAAVEALRLKLEEEEELEFEKRMQEVKWAKEFERKKEADVRQEEELRINQQRQTEADESKRIQDELMRSKMEEEEKGAREREALEKRAIEAERERAALEKKALEAQREREALEKKAEALREREALEKMAIEALREREAQEKALREKEIREQAERVMREREAAAKKLEDVEKETIMKKKLEDAERERMMKSKELEIQKSIKATGTPGSKAVPTTNLPTGWEKRLDRTTNRYYYIDHNKGKTQWTPPAPPVPSFTKTIEKLKEEPSVPSSRGLSRSYSSPDIKKMLDDEEAVTVTQPSFNRNNKPSTAILKPMPPRSAYSVRKRDLNPVYGSVGPALTGLRNLGNTCYMNSTIQCLNNTSPLIRYFLDESYLYDINRESSQGMQGEVVDEFAVVVKALWSGEYRSITPRDLKTTIGKYNSIFAGYQQQDSQEFLTFLLDGLNEGLNEVKKAPEIPEQNNDNLSDSEAARIAWTHHKLLSKSIIVELFQGQLKSSLMCRTCHKKSVTFQVFMSLSVPIPSSSRCTLMDCLREFLKPELMTGSCKWKCPRCNVEREAEKKIDLWKLPPILLIGLNRFYADGMWTQKKTTYVDFPVNDLDFSQVIIGPPPRHSYQLYGISNHYGTMEGGHYTAFCKNPVNKKWYKFDDQDVYEMSSSDVKSSAAFVLYYTSVDMPIPVYKPHL